ncbi:MAG: hypothetical protein RLZZ584_1218, partial [Pseudomonadota bacterium]
MPRPPMLGLLERLDRDIAQTRVPREVPFLRAERAVLLARLGHFERARQDVAAVRALPDAQTVPALGAWLWLADGLVDYFESVNERAYNRVQRAHALATASRSPRILALTAAWCAHLDLRRGNIDAVMRLLAESLQTATPDNHSALSRACVVVAGIYQGCYREVDAQPWYARARSHATLEGDGATLSSIMYNLAAVRIVNARLAEHFGTLDPTLAKRALLGAESSSHLDQAVQTRALGTLSWLQRAQILCVLGEHADALKL